MRRLVLGLLLAAIVVDIVYWSVWFTDRSLIASENNEAYYEFENAFALADVWLGVACALAWVALLKRWPSALFWLLCAGSAGVYLFSINLLYDLENGIFTDASGGVVEFVSVAATLVFSVTILVWTWRHRGELLSGRAADGVGSR